MSAPAVAIAEQDAGFTRRTFASTRLAIVGVALRVHAGSATTAGVCGAAALSSLGTIRVGAIYGSVTIVVDAVAARSFARGPTGARAGARDTFATVCAACLTVADAERAVDRSGTGRGRRAAHCQRATGARATGTGAAASARRATRGTRVRASSSACPRVATVAWHASVRRTSETARSADARLGAARAGPPTARPRTAAARLLAIAPFTEARNEMGAVVVEQAIAREHRHCDESERNDARGTTPNSHVVLASAPNVAARFSQGSQYRLSRRDSFASRTRIDRPGLSSTRVQRYPPSRSSSTGMSDVDRSAAISRD